MTKNETTPDIAILMPHYNAFEALKRSLRSLESDKPGRYDVVVVDDGSADPPDEETLQTCSRAIREVKVLRLPRNMGIETALNTGLDYIYEQGYSYIARLDCGDLCLHDRLQKQHAFLETDPHIAMVGSWAKMVGKRGSFIFRPPVNPDEIAKKIYINNPFVHPAVMFRTAMIRQIGHYPLRFPAAEDYAFFFEIVRRFPTANLPEVLLAYEINDDGISLSRRSRQIRSRIRVILNYFDFSPYAFYGLFRNLLLLALPYKLVETIKRMKNR